MISVFVFDPTENDPLSKVRGVGRYLQILKENFPKNTIFTDNIRQITTDSIFINPFFNFLQPPLTLRRIAKKQIAVIHDLIPLKYPHHFPAGIKGKINIFLNKLALKNYDLIITDSETSKKDIMKILGVNGNVVKVIYPCLPKIFQTSSLNQLPNPSPTSISDRFCLYVGDATWNKNLVNLAKAIKIINVTCVFVGKIFAKYSQSLIRNSKLKNKWLNEYKEFKSGVDYDKRFVLLDYVSDDKLMQLYQQAKCNILVSRDEGFGFSYLEAASQGCPSILSDIQVLREISNSQGALFANPNKPNDIANAVGEVYFNQDLRNKLGSVAKKRVQSFSKKRFTNEFAQILKF